MTPDQEPQDSAEESAYEIPEDGPLPFDPKPDDETAPPSPNQTEDYSYDLREPMFEDLGEDSGSGGLGLKLKDPGAEAEEIPAPPPPVGQPVPQPGAVAPPAPTAPQAPAPPSPVAPAPPPQAGAVPPPNVAPAADEPQGYDVPAGPTEGLGYKTSAQAMPAVEPSGEHVDPEFNASLDAEEVLDKMGFKGDAVYKEEKVIRIFCPIHHDQIRRSMTIVRATNTYKCSLLNCPANKGGTLVQLFSVAKEVSIPEAVRRLTTGTTEISVPEYELVDEAQELIESGDYDKALPLLQKAVEKAPKDETTRCRLAALQLEMGLRDEGINNYLLAAEDYGVRGELEKTLQIYNMLVLMSPNDLDIHEQMAYIAARLGNLEDALTKLKWITNALIERDQFDEALLRVNRMLELANNNTDFLILKADLLVAGGHQDSAQQHIAFAVQNLVSAGQLPSAMRLAEKGLEVAPGNDLIQMLYAEVSEELKKMGLDFSAIEGADEAAEEDDDDFFDWIASLEEEIQPGRSTANLAAITDSDIEQAQDEAAMAETLPTKNKPAPEDDPFADVAEPVGAPTTVPDDSTDADEFKPSRTPTAMQMARSNTVELPIDDARVMMCKENLSAAETDERMRMYQHLRSMYADVKASYEDGTLSEFEKKVIKDFYKAFCVAFKEYNEECGGDSMLTKF
jgi:tetratricopeptide (TPR) repeat protein